MKRTVYILMWLGCFLCGLSAQEIGSWKPYMAYYETTAVAEGNNYVFAVANGSLYSYGKEDNSIKFYSYDDGLSDNNISKIGYNPNVNTLLITYSGGTSEGNIDLLSENGVYNLPYLKNSTNIQDKTINSLYFHNEYAYLSTSFGILVINMEKQEIADTYKFSNDTVFSTCIKGNEIYAATTDGLRKASLNANLLDNQNWDYYPLNTTDFSSEEIHQVVLFKDRLCFYVEEKGVFYQDTDGSIKALAKDASIQSITFQNEKLIALTTNTARIWSDLSNYGTINLSQAGISSVYDIVCLKSTGNYWLAAGTNGLVGIKVNGNSAEVTVSNLISSDEAPKRNLASFMTIANDRLYVVGGGRWTNRYSNPGTLMVYGDGKWFNFNENQVFGKDYTSVAVDPLDPTHYFVSTYGEGLLEFREDKYLGKYNCDNSTLQTIYPDNPNLKYSYIRIAGIAFDKAGNLWVNNCSVSNTIHVLKSDGTWEAMPYANTISNVGMADKILVTSWGDKWMNIPYNNYTGIFVFNENDLNDRNDDQYNYFSSFSTSSGSAINISGCYCMAEDKNGNIWIGTNRGPIICPASVARYAVQEPSRVYCSQIVRYEDEDRTIPSGYFLDGEQVNTIAVDGGNRKWIGTEASGVFLVNEDGSETIENFTTDNSPLLSNKINCITIDDATGEVFIGTDKGLISYMGGATEGSENYSDVYAYPNPVRPEYADQVTITGLMENSNVKITDMAGHLIYQAKSLGGQLTWNCRNAGGSRVATGIYLVLASTPEGKESVVTKIMVVR